MMINVKHIWKPKKYVVTHNPIRLVFYITPGFLAKYMIKLKGLHMDGTSAGWIKPDKIAKA